MANYYKHIIVAVDGSKEGEYAFRKSIDVVKRNPGSTLYVTNIIDNRTAYGGSVIEHIQRQSKELLRSYHNQAKAEGIEQVRIISEYGSPRSAISVDLAKKVEADLIICGATGHNAVERFLIGSVSEAIVRTAKCDVLVIRTPE
ncbi:universal stress protein [Ornithinibacillus californiensis]|uniref:universal stress protein n=1 Tax=Ornithinibacillus californiensis TaxID=161536 RepID=UPI00064DF691|nr:universal stress protein [Ornithinibacillus californiensis]